MAKVMPWGETLKVLLDAGFLQDEFILGGFTTTQTRTNLVTNPSFETNTTGWAVQNSSTIARTTSESYWGIASLQITTSASNNNGIRTPVGTNVAVTAGLSYSLSAYVKTQTGTMTNAGLIVIWLNSGGSEISRITPTAITIDTTWQRLSVTGTAPVGAVSAALFIVRTSGAAGVVWFVDAILFEQTDTLRPYFDGTYYDQPYTGYTYISNAWTGTADASTSTSTWGLDSSIYGSLLDGTDVLDGSTDFVDVTEYVLSVGITRGRTDQLKSSFQPGVCQVVLDDRASGRSFDPANTASPYYQGDLGIAPRRFMQVYAGTAGNEPLFVGRVQDLDIEYEQPNLSLCTIIGVDDMSSFAKTELKAFNPTQQLTSARVNAILDRPEVAYSTATRNISTGLATLGTFAYSDGDNVASALTEVAESENGRFFVSRGGTATFQPRTSFTFSTAVAVFSDSGATAIPYQSLDVRYGAETLYNAAIITTKGNAVGTASDATSIAEYGITNYSANSLPLLDVTEATSLAQSIVNTYAEPVSRFDQISVLLNGLSGARINAIDQLEIGDVTQVAKTFSVGSPAAITQNVFIERIAHQITPGLHQVILGLGQANVLTQFILGGYNTTQTRTNLVTNPSFETNTTGWAALNSATISRITTDAYSGSACLQITTSVTSNTGIETSSSPAATAGTAYTASAYFKVPSGSISTLNIFVIWYNSGGSEITRNVSTLTTVTDTQGWVRISVTATAPAGTTSCDVRLSRQAAGSAGQVFQVDSILFEETDTLRPYFDGSTADAYSGYELQSGPTWTGTAHASTSTGTWGLISSGTNGDQLDDETVGLG